MRVETNNDSDTMRAFRLHHKRQITVSFSHGLAVDLYPVCTNFTCFAICASDNDTTCKHSMSAQKQTHSQLSIKMAI